MLLCTHTVHAAQDTKTKNVAVFMLTVLGASQQSRKAPVTFVMSVRLSAKYQRGTYWADFREI
jgi:hypothetical protein